MDGNLVQKVIKWIGCCMIVPSFLLILSWPLLLALFLGYSNTIAWSCLGIWLITGICGTLIYIQDF